MLVKEMNECFYFLLLHIIITITNVPCLQFLTPFYIITNVGVIFLEIFFIFSNKKEKFPSAPNPNSTQYLCVKCSVIFAGKEITRQKNRSKKI